MKRVGMLAGLVAVVLLGGLSVAPALETMSAERTVTAGCNYGGWKFGGNGKCMNGGYGYYSYSRYSPHNSHGPYAPYDLHYPHGHA